MYSLLVNQSPKACLYKDACQSPICHVEMTLCVSGTLLPMTYFVINLYYVQFWSLQGTKEIVTCTWHVTKVCTYSIARIFNLSRQLLLW